MTARRQWSIIASRRIYWMGKPEITKTTLRVPTPLWRKIRQRAIAEGISAELLVVNALKSYLKREG
jgi:hypothetical protein